MKRSMINKIVQQGIDFMAKHHFILPPFAHFSPEEWAQKGHDYDEIRTHNLGWDVTDLGGGDFENLGLLLFTIRNGKINESPKPYAEKIMMSNENQACGMHFHRHKMEDIVNRGGGNLVLKLYNAHANDDYKFSNDDVVFQKDGVTTRVPPGTCVILGPGESITIPPRLYHSFWAEEGHGPVLIGEISMVNDDFTDNVFHPMSGVKDRFPNIIEDEPPIRLLCTEYPEAK